MRVLPLAIDLYCGLGGWTEGLIAEGYRVVGFDCERHVYGDSRYPGYLVIQDVLTIHGSQFKSADLIVASPPCQDYSYRAMPWKRAKSLPPPDNSLFEACFRIKREAEEAAGRPIPLVVENVRGAQPFVGRARWHCGSFYLWGDVPALMPTVRTRAKRPGHDWNRFKKTGEVSPHWRMNGEDSVKEYPEFAKATNPSSVDYSLQCRQSSKGSASKAAAAHIAKIPLALARHIAASWHPEAQ